MLPMMCLHVSQTVHVACHSNSLIGSERFFRVTCSDVHCKSGAICERVQDRNVVTPDH